MLPIHRVGPYEGEVLRVAALGPGLTPQMGPRSPAFPEQAECPGSSRLILGPSGRLLPGLSSELQGQCLVAACSVNMQCGWGCTRPHFLGSHSGVHPQDLAYGRFWCFSQQAWCADLEVGLFSALRGCSLEMPLGPRPWAMQL